MRRALFLAIIGLGGAAILISLGVWQVQRLNWKEGVIADIESRILADPVALPANPDPARDAYLPVRATGTLGQAQLHVLVSQKEVGAGYRVISPLTLEDGRIILADLGFVVSSNKETLKTAGPADLTGNLQWPQEVDGFTPDPDLTANIWFARDVPAMARALGTDPVLLVTRVGSMPDKTVRPLPVETARIPNDHLQYAITWFSLAAIWLAMSFFFMRRRRSPTPKV
ncbi:SURF1 family protein [Sulfitobacter sp. SK012]|uniref:SURF1 family protein n=1 Tax=Sulfitobacter sp. SK012 TaxID=1389005 RepID=UPI000E0C02B2|nr:SURF1 family protein [Sulfitobacter sp. SK012]AXI45730.1 SURF1 family protein [Sulfitobacter sp. SK012]